MEYITHTEIHDNTIKIIIDNIDVDEDTAKRLDEALNEAIEKVLK